MTVFLSALVIGLASVLLLGRLCRRALWLEGGRVSDDGNFDDVVAAYVGA